MGKRGPNVVALLGSGTRSELVHRDNLVLVSA
jgi:hypothetical protein